MLRTVQSLCDDIAYDKNGTGIITYTKKIIAFADRDLIVANQVRDNLGSHGIATEKSGEHGVDAIGVYVEQSAAQRCEEAAENMYSVQTCNKVGQYDKRQ